MTRPVFEANLHRLFPELEELPHADTLARLLERIDVGQIEGAHLDMIRQLIRSKKFGRYLIGACYPIAIDGSQKLTRAQRLERKVGGKKQEGAKSSRHSWISDQPLHRRNVHSRCNLGARHRWGIEAGFPVEKHHGYQYEHCFSYDWETMRGYH